MLLDCCSQARALTTIFRSQNFMKTLMQCFAEEDKGVVFFESVLSIKNQRHTCIEAIPIPFNLFDTIPIYFQVSGRHWNSLKCTR